MSTLALWFELDESSARLFSDAIDAFAARFDTPRFTPHVTVFGGIWIDNDTGIELVDEIVGDASDVRIDFAEFGFDDMWSRSLYVRALPSEHMLAIHERTARALGIYGPLYAPFLSLMYGEFPRQMKLEAIEELQLRLPEQATVTALSLWHTDPTGVAMWRRLRRVPIPDTAIASADGLITEPVH